jgi:HSP20 family molecular chaperone IbpA
MTRVSLFNSPHMLGFDHFERVLDRIAKTSGEGYPPYNIEQIGEIGLRITLAVAGFTMDCLQVSVEDNQLIIRGRQAEDDPTRVFLHRGIAARQFQRAFVLAAHRFAAAAPGNPGAQRQDRAGRQSQRQCSRRFKRKMIMQNKDSSSRSTAPAMSEHAFALLGVEDVAYVKQVVLDGVALWAIVGADGVGLALAPNRALAIATALQNDRTPVSVH